MLSSGTRRGWMPLSAQSTRQSRQSTTRVDIGDTVVSSTLLISPPLSYQSEESTASTRGTNIPLLRRLASARLTSTTDNSMTIAKVPEDIGMPQCPFKLWAGGSRRSAYLRWPAVSRDQYQRRPESAQEWLQAWISPLHSHHINPCSQPRFRKLRARSRLLLRFFSLHEEQTKLGTVMGIAEILG